MYPPQDDSVLVALASAFNSMTGSIVDQCRSVINLSLLRSALHAADPFLFPMGRHSQLSFKESSTQKHTRLEVINWSSCAAASKLIAWKIAIEVCLILHLACAAPFLAILASLGGVAIPLAASNEVLFM